MTAWVFPDGRGGLRERLGLASGTGTAHPETRFTARLPSRVDELFFDASFDVVWARTGGGENANLEALVLRHLYEVARRVTATEPVTQAEAVQARLNVVLGVPTPVDGGQVTLVRARSTLTVDAASREQMRAYEEMAREDAMERARRERDLERWRYLADEVFSDPALARMWWLDGHPERLPELARMDPIFDRLVEIARADAYPDETDAYPEESGAYAEESGAYAEESGAYAEETGAYAEESGAYAEEIGANLNGAGAPPDRAGAYAEEAGAYPDEARPHHDAAGPYPERARPYPHGAGAYPGQAVAE